MEAAVAGLVGVFVGALLSFGKDWVLARRLEARDERYLCLLVASALDKFAIGCADVASDDGEEDRDGYTRASSARPDFDPLALQVQWKLMPLPLLQRVMDLPNQIYSANRSIQAVAEYVACPPDYDDVFEERQWHFSSLGLEAVDLASALRRRVGVPVATAAELDAKAVLSRRRDGIKVLREQRLREHAHPAISAE